jgi:hypothetical protein
MAPYTEPDKLRHQKVLQLLTSLDTVRRVLNRGKPIPVGNFGNLKALFRSPERYDQFWKVAVSMQEEPESPICFFPFELSLTNAVDVSTLRCDLKTVLDSDLPALWEIENAQARSAIRIYPHGIGVVRLSLALTFKNNVDVVIAARVANSIQELYFVDANDSATPCRSVLAEAVDRTASVLFHGTTSATELCWLPPNTTFSMVTRDESNNAFIDSLTYLVSRTPANEGGAETETSLRQRISALAASNSWREGKLLAIADTGGGAFYIGSSAVRGVSEKLRRLQTWFKETHELVSVAAYSKRAFTEELAKVADLRRLDSEWRPSAANGKFKLLATMLKEMTESKRARHLMKRHFEKLGVGALKNFARQVWRYTETGDFEPSLDYIREWTQAQALVEPRLEYQELLNYIHVLREMPEAFK